MVAVNGNSNTYEELRKQRLEENKKRFEDLGISDISKSLSKLSSPEKKAKLKLKVANPELVEPRRSSRARTTIASYKDDLDIELSPTRKRARGNSSWTSYIARPVEEVKLAAYEDRIRALRAAEEFQTTLPSGKPSFVKSMVRSHVYSCFWLGLPTQFCKAHLPKKDVDMILEDEDGSTCDARFLGSRTGLSGGWRGFALEHKLDDGDAVVFELIEPDKFKLYIFRVSSSALSCQTQEEDVAEEDSSTKAKTKASNKKLKLKSKSKSKSRSSKKQNSKKVKENKVETPEPQDEPATELISNDVNSVEKNCGVEENGEKDETAAINMEVESPKINGKQKRNTIKPRKKNAERLFRRRV